MALNIQKSVNEQSKKYGVLVINIGAPKNLSVKSIRRYLKLFLSDKRVIELHPIIWKVILNTLILPIRPKKSLAKYQLIWKKNELSPLLKNSINLVQKLQNSINEQQNNVLVRVAMNYSEPFVDSVIRDFQRLHVSHIIVLPLFPQYSGTTVGASLDKVWNTLLTLRFQPEVSSTRSFYQHPDYINALAQQVKSHWQQYGRSELLLLSYHGIPTQYVQKGDPYFQHCLETTKALQKQLALENDQIKMGFQSRFSKLKWLQPSIQELFNELPKQGIRSIDVFSPSFVLDCLETLEELNIFGRKLFMQAGGKSFHYIPCLNDNPLLINTLRNIIQAKIN